MMTLPFQWALPAVLTLAAMPLLAQDAFPLIHGETTDGSEVVLPLPASHGFTLVAVVLSKKAQPALEQWYAPAWHRFVAKQGLFADSYTVDLILLPVFTGLNKAAYGSSMDALRKDADPDVARHVVFFKGDAHDLVEALGIRDRDVPHFFLLDRTGRILARESGTFSVEKLDALEAPMLN